MNLVLACLRCWQFLTDWRPGTCAECPSCGEHVHAPDPTCDKETR